MLQPQAVSGSSPGSCAPAVQPGMAINSSKLHAFFPAQHDHDLPPSWNTGAPLWYTQALSLLEPSSNHCALHPLFMHLYHPSASRLCAFGLVLTVLATDAAAVTASGLDSLKLSMLFTPAGADMEVAAASLRGEGANVEPGASVLCLQDR